MAERNKCDWQKWKCWRIKKDKIHLRQQNLDAAEAASFKLPAVKGRLQRVRSAQIPSDLFAFRT